MTKKSLLIGSAAAVAMAVSNSVFAITTLECSKGYVPAKIEVTADFSTELDSCQLLEDKKTKKFVQKNLPGSIFAYPTLPGTCYAGPLTSGTLEIEGVKINLSGSFASAQRITPDAASINPSNGGALVSGQTEDGVPFISSAVVSVLNLEGTDTDFEARLLSTERFSVKLDTFPAIDVEDFTVVGSSGIKARGNLNGGAEIFTPGQPFDNVPFNAHGTLCVKASSL